jgi:hypothetical protein
MFADLLLEGAVTRIEGPLLFAKREARVGLNAAVEIIGNDGGTRLGRVAHSTSSRWSSSAVHRRPQLTGTGPAAPVVAVSAWAGCSGAA